MKKILCVFGLVIFTLMAALSCSSDANDASELAVSNETFETIANPFTISEEDAILEALAFSERIVENQRTEGALRVSQSLYAPITKSSI